MTSNVCFEDYVSRLQSLSRQETLSFSEELAPLLDSYTKNIKQLSRIPHPQVVSGVRSVFEYVQNLFFKFQHILSDSDQGKFLVFVAEVPITAPGVSDEIATGLEKAIVRICRVGVEHIIKAQLHVKAGEDLAELFRLFRALAVNLQFLTPQSTPLIPFLELYEQCTRIFVHNLPRLDDETLGYIKTSLWGTERTITEFQGLRPRLLSHWADLLTEVQVDRVVSFQHAERLLITAIARLEKMAALGLQAHPDVPRSVHSIMDWVEKLLSSMVQRRVEPKQLVILGGYRIVMLGHLCGIYPRALLERYEQGKQIGGVVSGPRLSSLSNDPLFHLYFGVLSDLVQNSAHCQAEAPFEELFSSIRLIWQSRTPPVNLAPFVWSSVADVIRRLPPISVSGLRNLSRLLVTEIIRMQSSDGYVSQEASDAFLDAVEAMHDLVPNHVRGDSELVKGEVDCLPSAVVEVMCDKIRPTMALDWFERLQKKGSCGALYSLTKTLETIYSAFKILDPKTAPSAYVSEQFALFLRFVLRHLPSMSSQEVNMIEGLLSECRTKWVSDPEVGLGLVKEWTAQIEALLSQLSPSKGFSAKSLGLYVQRLMELLTFDLYGFLHGGEPGPGVTEAMGAMLGVVDELVSASLKVLRAPEPANQLVSAHTDLFGLFTKFAPVVLIERLAAAKPEKTPVEFLRKLEKILLASERFSSIADQEMRLLLLELVMVELERYCRKKGLPLVRPAEPSPLHLLMEESMAMDDLDVACVAYCKDYASEPEKERWVLFTLRFYVRRCIEKLRKECLKAHREQEGLFRDFSPEVRTKSSPSLGSSLYFFDLELPHPGKIYKNPFLQSYEELYNVRTAPSNPEEVLLKTHIYFTELFTRAGLQARKVQEQFLRFWPHHERGVTVLKQHLAQTRGYYPLGTLNKKVPLEGGFPLLDYKDVSSGDVEARFVQPWVLGLLSGGELGLARAIAASFAPGNATFANRFLQELELLDDDGEEEHSPSSVAAKESFCGIPEAPKPSAFQGKGGGKLRSPHRAKHAKRPGRACSSPKCEEETAPLSPPKGAPPETEGLSQKAREGGLVEAFHALSLSEPVRPVVQKKKEKPSLPRAGILPLLSLDGEERAITVADVERCMQKPLGPIDRRVHRWKSAFFCAPSEDQYDRHTHPFQLIPLIREYGEKEAWGSALGRMNEHFVCIGRMERYGRGLSPLFGVFSEAFSSEGGRELYHHYLHDRSEEALRDSYRRSGSFFDSDICHTPKAKSPFQERLCKKFCDFKSFFSSLTNVPPQLCCGGRFAVQISDMTIRIDDRKLGKAHTLALRVRAV
jgi:hypothetical protein